MTLRIERIDFNPWGCFADLTIEFRGHEHDVVHLIEGPNAAGKSTASRGERGLLYGIPSRTVDAHTFAYPDLRIGARLMLDDHPVEVVRRKGSTRTLLDSAGHPFPEDRIVRALGGLSEEVYEALFRITHETLVQGGEELLQGRGEVGSSLFAAATGISALHETIGRFDAEAEEIFNPRARKDPFHRAISDLNAAQKRMRDATLRPARQRALDRENRAIAEARDALSAEIRRLEGEARSLERNRSIAPLVERRAELGEELEALSDVPELSSDASEDRARATSVLDSATERVGTSKAAAADIERELDGIEVSDALIARAEDIRAAHEGISATRKAAEDRRKREGELSAAEAGVANAAVVIGVERGEIEGLRRPATAKRVLDQCLRENGELNERGRSSRVRVEELARQLDQDEAALAEIGDARDARPVVAALRAARKLGPIEAQATEAEAEARCLTSEAEAALARLHPAPASVEGLRLDQVPTRAAVAAAVQEQTRLRRERDELADAAGRLSQASTELEEQRHALELAGTAPTLEDLRTTRSERDERWGGLRTMLDRGAKPKPSTIAGYEQAVAKSDAVADARTADAAAIERAAHLEARAQRLVRDRDQLSKRRAELNQAEASLRSEWDASWDASAASAPSIVDGSGWLDAREQIVDTAMESAKLAAYASGRREEANRNADALCSRLKDAGISCPSTSTLEELIERAEVEVAESEERNSERERLEVAIERTTRDLNSARRALDDTSKTLAAWESEWPARRQESGLPDTATPEAAHEIVRAIGEALGDIDRVADLRRRIEGIDRDRDAYQALVADLRDGVAPDLAELPAERAAAVLMSRLAATEADRARRDDLTKRLLMAEQEVEAGEVAVRDAREGIGHLLTAAGCNEIAELPAIERRSARARELGAELRRIEREIAQVGEGRLDQLVAEVAGFDRDAAALRLAELRERIEELGAERDSRQEEMGERKRRLADAECDITAVEAAQDVELARTRIRALSGEYAKAKLSSVAVRRAMERYRRLHQDPLLRRANDLFSRFTLGSFVELFVDHDEREGAILVGRQRDRVLKRVGEMSRGTREQLFLALRLAAIERYIATSGPVPVVFDDVFLESDEPRSERIFAALGELARNTQVIVLTHHQHLVALGKRILGDRLAVHHLPDTAPALREAEGPRNEDTTVAA